MPHERRVAEDVGTFFARQNFIPIFAEGIALNNVRRGTEREAVEALAKGFGGERVHLVIHQPECDFGNAHRPFRQLDAVELVHIYLAKIAHVEFPLIFAVDFAEDFDFEQAQFAVGEDEKVSAAASWIKEIERPQLAVECLQVRAAACRAVTLELIEFRAQVIEKERADVFHNVALAGVMPALLAAGAVIHHALKERAENSGGNFGPLKFTAIEQRLAHVAVEAGETETFVEQAAVDVAETVERIVVFERVIGFGFIQPIEKFVEARAEVCAIVAGLRADELREGFGLKNESVFGEEAKKNADKETFEIVSAQAAELERVVQFAHALVGFFIGRIFGIKADAGLPEHESKGANLPWKFGKREVVRRDFSPIEQREVALLFRFKIVKNEFRKIGNENEAGNFFPTIFAREVFDVSKGLGLREREVFAKTFMLNEETAFPEQVNRAFVAFEIADIFLEGGERSAAQTEDVEEIVPERLFLGAFRTVARVFA